MMRATRSALHEKEKLTVDKAKGKQNYFTKEEGKETING